MNILLTNDDGIYADGIAVLYQALTQAGHQVHVAAPGSERSAAGHAITVADPLRVSYVELEGRIAGHAVDGTPVDCVKLALSSLLGARPDLVLSGINRGSNTGDHILYSGTVSAASEAAVSGLPAIAVSLEAPFDRRRDLMSFSYAAQFAARLCETVFEQGGLPAGTLLNVNVPSCRAEDIRGVRIARQAKFCHENIYEARTDPFGRAYYWLNAGNVEVNDPPDDAVDFRLVRAGYVVVCPLRYDLTNYEMLEELKKWDFQKEKTA
ncbi:5'/3'-nucleotidase SurE [candidate division KSB3 bacterium]|uniref:5'-nucleotidase SurE n=1 Tax=candidate division KSB3 bacterium TaxID=2044937 RepID=A0A2G6EE94_9BACT|nr:MAG: 5'/3'-nucleotidase SurE [candidate division KSB3 bacterium]PIE28394.1 MAG: 5'/3'-nucleotidase SurE [candidate division KSB3 bacterium]